MELRIIPRLETSPFLLRFSQTILGKVTLVAVFSILVYFHGKVFWWELGIALTLISLLPQFRRQLIGVTTAYWLYHHAPYKTDLVWFSANFEAPFLLKYHFVYVIICFLMAWLYIILARKWSGHWLFERPVRNLLLLYIVMVVYASSVSLPSVIFLSLWSILIIAGKYLWFLAYALSERGKENHPFSLTDLMQFQPFWGNSNVPFPKSATYMQKIEAKSPLDLATVQIKGLKLMLWASVMLLGLVTFDQIVYGSHGFLEPFLKTMPVLPTAEQAITKYLMGKPFPRWICWLVLVANVIKKVLVISISGSLIIAICRMSGFNALRNTYKPLASRSIAEFYNRLYYYFKELLVEFFFYPTYFRFFKQHPRVRIFFATFAAAGFGNAIFHFLRDIIYIMDLSFWSALVNFQVYFLYCLILGTAIGLSQLRSMGRPPPKQGVINSLFIWCFYCLVMILDEPIPSLSIIDYGSFMLNMFIPFAR